MLEIRSGIPLISVFFFTYEIYSIWWFMREYDSLANLCGNRLQWSSLVWSGLDSTDEGSCICEHVNQTDTQSSMSLFFLSKYTYNFRGTQSNSVAITVISLILWKLLIAISDAFNFPLGMRSCTCFTHVMTLNGRIRSNWDLNSMK